REERGRERMERETERRERRERGEREGEGEEGEGDRERERMFGGAIVFGLGVSSRGGSVTVCPRHLSPPNDRLTDNRSASFTQRALPLRHHSNTHTHNHTHTT